MVPVAPTKRESRESGQGQPLLLDLYVSLIRNMAYYAVEFGDEITGPYRHYVELIAAEIGSAAPTALEESRGTLRALLRDYRDRASTYLNHLREELADTANALQRTLDSLSQTDDYQETHLRQALSVLRDLASGESKLPLLPTLASVAAIIERSLEQIGRQHQLTVSQFLVEIGLLHKRIDALEAAVSIDALTQLFTRSEMEQRIRSSQSAAPVLLLRVEGFRESERVFTRDVTQQLAAAFTKRLRNSLLPNALIGRWAEEAFLAITPGLNPEAANSDWLREHLSGAYACLQGGKTVRPSIQVDIALVQLTPGQAEQTLRQIVEFFKTEEPGAARE